MSDTADPYNVRVEGYLSPDGELLQALPPSFADGALLQLLYRDMVFARALDTKACALQRSGRLGTYAPGLGQEAVNTGIAAAMRPEDVLLPSFREHALQLGRGVTPEELLQFWSGDERGSNFSNPKQDFPVCITVAGHAPQAVGVALALKLRGSANAETGAAVCVLGDGATSKGDFYEALNAAGVWSLPLLFVIINNQWAISTPRARQSAAATLAQKAIAAGFTGVQVDGNDIVSVATQVDDALVKARAGHGPALIEFLTYRLGDHTTADDATRYRDARDVERAEHEEPIRRLRTFLISQSQWSEGQERELLAECAARVETVVDNFLALPPQAPESMFESLYAELPTAFETQHAALGARLGEGLEAGVCSDGESNDG